MDDRALAARASLARLAEVDEPQLVEPAPPLWKDLTAAVIAAVLLWGAAAALVG